MYKIKALIKRQPHLSYQQFVEHYENWHAPWGYANFCTQHLRRYIRHYVQHPAEGPEFPFDVITEFWFNNEQDFRKWCDFKDHHPLIADLKSDELSFYNVDTVVVVPFISHEHIQEQPLQRLNPGQW